MTEPAIIADGLTRDFARPSDRGGPLRAVDGLSIEVAPGTVFGFLGPNGAGKTTTIRLLLGLLRPTAGSATVLGFDTRDDAAEVRERVGALLERPGLYERLTVDDNLELYGRIGRIPPAQRRARIKELLDGLGLWERRHEVLGDWSHGMKQKVAVARAMLNRPQLIFFDEPTAGLDPIAAAALREDIAGLARSEGVTVFLTTHNLVEAERLCSRVAVIRQGTLVAAGHPDELRAMGGRPRVTILGRGFTDDMLAVLRARPEIEALAVEGTDADVAARPPVGGPPAAGAQPRPNVAPSHLTIELAAAGSEADAHDVSVAPVVEFLVSAGAQIEEVRKGTASLEEAFLSLVREGPPDARAVSARAPGQDVLEAGHAQAESAAPSRPERSALQQLHRGSRRHRWPLADDVRTIVWKELKEILFQRGSLKRGLLTDLALPVLVLGVFLPLIAREGWVGPTGMILYVWMPPYLAVGIVANGFAGERERHTLESLLSTRLPDEAILLGKMLAAIIYGVAVTLMIALLGTVTINVFFSHGRFLFFSPGVLAVVLFTSLLLTSLVAGAGTLISLRAPTVRQAAQRMGFILVLPGMVVTGIVALMPAAWQTEIGDWVLRTGVVPVALSVLFGLVAIDIGLFLACLVRFKRDRLVLEA